mgnify:CR=1 FL=1
MAHTIYENFVLENKLENLLTTAVDLNSYMTVDNSLTATPGMKKTIHKYTATGNVQDLAMGTGNSSEITVSFSEEEYEVKVTQGKFSYYDEQEMTDPMVVDMAQWINAVLEDKQPLVLPEQALVVSEILEAIYTSAKTGKAVYFD